MYKKLFLIFLSVMLLTSCADRKEIDDYAYVIAAGIDEAENGKYKFTVSLANVNSIGETKDEKGGNMSSVTAVATDFYTALDIINNNVSKKINLSHTKLIVFSSAVARSGIKSFTDSFVRELKIRPGTIVAVSENCEDYLKNLNPMLEINPEKYFKEIFETDNTNYAVRSYLSDFFYATNGAPETVVLPVLGVMGKDVENSDYENNDYGENDFGVDKVPISAKNRAIVSGIAYFSGDKMIAQGTLKENIFHLLLTKSAKKTAYSARYEDEQVAVLISEFKKPEIKVLCKENPKICLRLFIDCEAVYIQDEVSKNLKGEKLEKFIEEDIKKNIVRYLNKTASYLKTDTENFSRCARKSFLTQKAWNEYNWDEKYKNSTFDVDVKVNIARPGVLGE